MPSTQATPTKPARTERVAARALSATAWGDRFQVPTAQELLSGLDAPSRKAMKMLLHALEGLPGAVTSLRWHGVWGWTLVVRTDADAEHGHAQSVSRPALAYVVCNPASPRVSVPVCEDRLATLAIRKLSKRVREGIGHAPPVLGVRWPAWEVSASEPGNDVVALAAELLTHAGER